MSHLDHDACEVVVVAFLMGLVFAGLEGLFMAFIILDKKRTSAIW